jgi:hypothetical protein
VAFSERAFLGTLDANMWKSTTTRRTDRKIRKNPCVPSDLAAAKAVSVL